jgi:hypothetical protein
MTVARTRHAVALALVLAVVAPAVLVAAELRERFDRGPLDTGVWSLCQSSPRLIGFAEEPPDAAAPRFLVSSVDDARGDAECVRAVPAVPGGPAGGASLGPSMLFDRPAVTVASTARAIQRNELRFADRARYGHVLDDPHWYALTFRMSGDIPTSGSVRWVSAQWKYDGAWPHSYAQSPFLAQRYDNGVLHVTVQADRCRCMIARAAGDPDALAAAHPVPTGAGGLVPAAPLRCVWTGGDAREGAACTPPDLRLWVRSPGEMVSLPDPRDRWVAMMYHVRGGPDGDGLIDVYADGRFVVRAEGAIGYRGGAPGRVKFKFGTYRDRMPGTVHMAVDELCLSRSAAACRLVPAE